MAISVITLKQIQVKDQRLLDKAIHNRQVCNILFATGNASDWVLTTAFYSTIHFVYYELFPDKFDIRNRPASCGTFDEYYRMLNSHESKHSVTEDLVNEYLTEIGTSFSTLRKMCFNARYKFYQVTQDEITLVRECIDEIPEFC